MPRSPPPPHSRAPVDREAARKLAREYAQAQEALQTTQRRQREAIQPLRQRLEERKENLEQWWCRAGDQIPDNITLESIGLTIRRDTTPRILPLTKEHIASIIRRHTDDPGFASELADEILDKRNRQTEAKCSFRVKRRSVD